MDIDKAFGTDESKTSNGVWFALYGEVLVAEALPETEVDNPPARFLIASSDSPESEALARKYQLRFRGAIAAGGEAATDALREVAAKVISECLVKDWRNLSSGGELVKFSTDAVYKLVKKYARLRMQIERAAGSHDPYQLDDDAAKNS